MGRPQNDIYFSVDSMEAARIKFLEEQLKYYESLVASIKAELETIDLDDLNYDAYLGTSLKDIKKIRQIYASKYHYYKNLN